MQGVTPARGSPLLHAFVYGLQRNQSARALVAIAYLRGTLTERLGIVNALVLDVYPRP